MQNTARFMLMILFGAILIFSQISLVIAGERFVDNGDGTVTDTERRLMWQKADNGKEVTYEKALEYCATLRLGGYTGWRLPLPEEHETAVVFALMMPRHSRDALSKLDLYWSLDPAFLLPFNYRPAHGAEVSDRYPAKDDDQAYVRAVRSFPLALQ